MIWREIWGFAQKQKNGEKRFYSKLFLLGNFNNKNLNIIRYKLKSYYWVRKIL